ncbi:TPA: helix-turn-helix domain-containing protein [Klebsiella oxytoca]
MAFDAGYKSLEAFIRDFHGMFGVSPSQYRKSQKFQ